MKIVYAGVTGGPGAHQRDKAKKNGVKGTSEEEERYGSSTRRKKKKDRVQAQGERTTMIGFKRAGCAISEL